MVNCCNTLLSLMVIREPGSVREVASCTKCGRNWVNTVQEAAPTATPMQTALSRLVEEFAKEHPEVVVPPANGVSVPHHLSPALTAIVTHT